MSKAISLQNSGYFKLAMENEPKQSPLQKALVAFETRLGVSYNELATSKEAQRIARKNLDKETEQLREKYLK